MDRPLESLRDYLDLLRNRGLLTEVTAEVDPRLEVAEIVRRQIAGGGPAILFRRVRGSAFPLAMNLFGTPERVSLAFGDRPKRFLERLVEAAHTMMPPTPRKLWGLKGLGLEALRVGMKRVRRGPVLEVEEAPDLTRLPATTSWHSDGGPFFTFGMTYTENPSRPGKHNLGLYRMQVHSPTTTGMHCQIHKGAGFHLHEAERLGKSLPATVYLGGPPALFLAAIAPLPEEAGEMLLASLLLGHRLPVIRGKGPHPIPAACEVAIEGFIAAGERHPEGPFGDHYGYNSLVHHYPVFHATKVRRRRDAILPATVVGRPRQEDFFLGDYLQDLLSPLFPLVMPSVRSLWSYGETGFHSLAAAVVTERYPREALVSGLRILGEGQLSLTKCLLLLDRPRDLRDFRGTWTDFLARSDFATDVIVLGHTAMDSLDYTGPMVNRGSKALFVGVGEVKRSLPERFEGDLPAGVPAARVFSPGCLVLAGKPFVEDPEQAGRVARHEAFRDWPLLVLVDDLAEATASTELFLWTVFTRFEPGGCLFARDMTTSRLHTGLTPPVVFDARMRPSYPEVLEVDRATRALVDRRWPEYGLPG